MDDQEDGCHRFVPTMNRLPRIRDNNLCSVSYLTTGLLAQTMGTGVSFEQQIGISIQFIARGIGQRTALIAIA